MGKNNRPSEMKTLPAFILEGKQDDAEVGIVEHLISVFGVEDLGQDVCHPGSFSKTLQERKHDVRVLDMHNRKSTSDALGVPLDIWEVGRSELPQEVLEMYPEATGGVKARTQFLLETPEGHGAYVRLRSGAVKEFSFAYDAIQKDYTNKKSGGRTRNLREVKLYEYGPTLFGMMPGARTIGCKKLDGYEEDPDDPDPETGTEEANKSEAKVIDETETTIQIRVKDSGGFQKDSIRTISIDKGKGIQARIGKLEGESSTTIQAYIFDKEKWDVERAKKWVSDHKKALIILVPEAKAESEDGSKSESGSGDDAGADAEPGGPEKCVCPKCGHKQAKKRGEPCRSVKCPKCGTKMVADTGKEDEDAEKESKPKSADLMSLLEIEQAQIEIALEAGPARPPTS